MAANSFFSGRIPQSLFNSIEEYRQGNNVSKTEVLIKALSAYINVPVRTHPAQTEVDASRFESLEIRVERLEKQLAAQQTQLSKPDVQMSLDDIQTDNINDNETDNIGNQNLVVAVDNEIDNHSQASDNNEDNLNDNSQIEELEQKELIPQPGGIFIGNMRTVEVTKLAGLEDSSHINIGGKLNRTAKSNLQSAVIGQYTCIYTGRTDKRGKTGKFEMLWDVYQNS